MANARCHETAVAEPGERIAAVERISDGISADLTELYRRLRQQGFRLKTPTGEAEGSSSTRSASEMHQHGSHLTGCDRTKMLRENLSDPAIMSTLPDKWIPGTTSISVTHSVDDFNTLGPLVENSTSCTSQ